MATLGFNRGAMVRALACHKCGRGSHPDSDTIRVLRMLLLFALASRGFPPGTPPVMVMMMMMVMIMMMMIIIKSQVAGGITADNFEALSRI